MCSNIKEEQRNRMDHRLSWDDMTIRITPEEFFELPTLPTRVFIHTYDKNTCKLSTCYGDGLEAVDKAPRLSELCYKAKIDGRWWILWGVYKANSEYASAVTFHPIVRVKATSKPS